MPNTQRPDPSKCMSGRHDWTPPNMKHNGHSWSCRPCQNEKCRDRKRVHRARNPHLHLDAHKGPRMATVMKLSEYEMMRESGEGFNYILRTLETSASTLSRLLDRHKVPVPAGLRNLAYQESREREAFKAVD